MKLLNMKILNQDRRERGSRKGGVPAPRTPPLPPPFPRAIFFPHKIGKHKIFKCEEQT